MSEVQIKNYKCPCSETGFVTARWLTRDVVCGGFTGIVTTSYHWGHIFQEMWIYTTWSCWLLTRLTTLKLFIISSWWLFIVHVSSQEILISYCVLTEPPGATNWTNTWGRLHISMTNHGPAALDKNIFKVLLYIFQNCTLIPYCGPHPIHTAVMIWTHLNIYYLRVLAYQYNLSRQYCFWPDF